ncbi:MAG: GNAT family N-acetyltransferase [Armatimonadetes bacterium]|nr:GNAT family N-acetyltransferase [Armatimonadota bacterium]
MVEVRWATVEDVADIESVRIAAWRAAYQEILPATVLAGLTTTPERVALLSERITERKARFLVAILDGVNVGHLVSGVPQEFSDHQIGALYVSPFHQGRRIGPTLVGQDIALAIQEGASSASIWSLEKNDRAARLYGETFGADEVLSGTYDIEGTTYPTLGFIYRDLPGLLQRLETLTQRTYSPHLEP